MFKIISGGELFFTVCKADVIPFLFVFLEILCKAFFKEFVKVFFFHSTFCSILVLVACARPNLNHVRTVRANLVT